MGDRARRILSWTVFVLVVTGAYLIAGPTVLGGPASYVIVDGRSMEPTYSHRDLVVAYERATYDIGDVIVYDAPVDTQFEVIHRIVAPADGGFVTQGDNRDQPDGWIAPHDRIYGAAVLHIPRGGVIVAFLRQPSTVLAVVAGWLTFAYLERQERKRDASAGGPDGRDERDTSVDDAVRDPYVHADHATSPDGVADAERP